MTPKSKDWCLCKRRENEIWTQRENGHMKTQTETEGMLPKGKERQEHLEQQEARKNFPYSLWKECFPSNILSLNSGLLDWERKKYLLF